MGARYYHDSYSAVTAQKKGADPRSGVCPTRTESGTKLIRDSYYLNTTGKLSVSAPRSTSTPVESPLRNFESAAI